MDEGQQWLKGVAARMNREVDKGAAAKPERVTVRKLLKWFGYERRRAWINDHIRKALKKFKLRTDPDFRLGPLDSQIVIELVPRPAPPSSDPTRRIGALNPNRELTSVKPENLLEVATTNMQMKDYSQLPVMKTDRDVVGIVSWQSIGTNRALGNTCKHVSQCLDDHVDVIPSGTRLFDAIRKASERGYVLVQREDKKITRIVTAVDLLEFLAKLARPFLLVGEIEGHLRNLIRGKFTLDQLQAASDNDQPIEDLADLTFGAYCRLLENRENWACLKLNIDRGKFVQNLDTVRKIRNAIMHFDPDGLSDNDRQTIQKAARFFDKLVAMTHS